MKTKKIVGMAALLIGFVVLLGGCTEKDKVNYNLTQEADNFNIVRQVTVINCIEGDVLFQMTGKMAITADTADNQLEIIVENEDGSNIL